MDNDKKNYSFYMPTDFNEKVEKLRSSMPALKGLSISQCVYFIISDLASKTEDKSK